MIKILACALMLIDHIGHAFFPNIMELRLIGRLSMPLFAYAIARGAHHTHDRKKYIIRIAILAVVSQIPFALFLRLPLFTDLNICFTWLFALLIIVLQENIKISKSFKYLSISIIVAITIFVKMDYGLYAVLIVLVFYHLDIKTKQFSKIFPLYILISMALILTNVLQSFSLAHIENYIYSAIFQLTSIASLPIIRYVAPRDKKLKINKYIFYWFYPVHLALIAIVSYLL